METRDIKKKAKKKTSTIWAIIKAIAGVKQ
jgi:hypothetical protein